MSHWIPIFLAFIHHYIGTNGQATVYSSEHYHLVSDLLLPWVEADNFCTNNYGSRLANIHTVSDNDEMHDLIVTNLVAQNAWIGLSDRNIEQTWRWIDGTPTNFLRWKLGRPNILDGNVEDCVSVTSTAPLVWVDEGCMLQRPFVCTRFTPSPTTEPVAVTSTPTGDTPSPTDISPPPTRRVVTASPTTQSVHTSAPSSSTTQKVHTSSPSSSTTQSVHTSAPSISTTQKVYTSAPSSSTTQSVHTSSPSSSTTQSVHTSAPSIATTQKVYTSAPSSSTTHNVVTAHPTPDPTTSVDCGSVSEACDLSLGDHTQCSNYGIPEISVKCLDDGNGCGQCQCTQCYVGSHTDCTDATTACVASKPLFPHCGSCQDVTPSPTSPLCGALARHCDSGSNACEDGFLCLPRFTYFSSISAYRTCYECVCPDTECDQSSSDASLDCGSDLASCDATTIRSIIFTDATTLNCGQCTYHVTDEPTSQPTSLRTVNPTKKPTKSPTNKPTQEPTDAPIIPTPEPTRVPLNSGRTYDPTISPSYGPSDTPSKKPTSRPTTDPSHEPTPDPTPQRPSDDPSSNPSLLPTVEPSEQTSEPTQLPTAFGQSRDPTEDPTQSPIKSPTTTGPTHDPTSPTPEPTRMPLNIGETHKPTESPTDEPTEIHTISPTYAPTTERSLATSATDGNDETTTTEESETTTTEELETTEEDTCEEDEEDGVCFDAVSRKNCMKTAHAKQRVSDYSNNDATLGGTTTQLCEICAKISTSDPILCECVALAKDTLLNGIQNMLSEWIQGRLLDYCWDSSDCSNIEDVTVEGDTCECAALMCDGVVGETKEDRVGDGDVKDPAIANMYTINIGVALWIGFVFIYTM